MYKHCPEIKDELFLLVKYIWDNECLLENMASARFKMHYKNKGSPDDPTKYRCIGLVNHAYKAIANIILTRILDCQEGFIKD